MRFNYFYCKKNLIIKINTTIILLVQKVMKIKSFGYSTGNTDYSCVSASNTVNTTQIYVINIIATRRCYQNNKLSQTKFQRLRIKLTITSTVHSKKPCLSSKHRSVGRVHPKSSFVLCHENLNRNTDNTRVVTAISRSF